MTKLFSYVVARDVGFAPNPFYGICTLATCKPQVRSAAEVGDWVVGTGSVAEMRTEHIVYAMQVKKIVTFGDYWSDPRFQDKKPYLQGSLKQACGDNIYYKESESEEWQQADSHHSLSHGAPNTTNIRRDTRVDRVLISEDFIYWGNNSISLPLFSGESILKKGQGHRSKFPPEVVDEFVEWFYSFPETGRIGYPIRWDRNDFKSLPL